jgi:hypothetical protein
VAGDGRHVDVAESFFFVPHVSLFLEDSQLGADGGVARVAGEIAHHFGGSRASAPEQDVHDLPLTAGENGVQGLRHARQSASGGLGQLFLDRGEQDSCNVI